MVDEVLPTIRRHGMYAIDESPANDEFLERAIVQLRAERAKRLAAEQALLEAALKVSYYDIVLQSDSLLTTTEIEVSARAELARALGANKKGRSPKGEYPLSN